jgi:ELP3 family radical SAM enzyme/protein acetyltransferase
MSSEYFTPESIYKTPSEKKPCGLIDVEDLVHPKKELNLPVLEQYIQAIIKLSPDHKTRNDIDDLIKKLNKIHKMCPSYIHLLYAYRKMCSSGIIPHDPLYVQLFQSKSYRSQSGVLVIAVFTSPYPKTTVNGQIVEQSFSCAFDCYYCPNEPGKPRSYFEKLPGVLRATRNKFNAVSQFRDRASTYIMMGHPIDKIELLVLGGTWSSYPSDYQECFIRDLFYAANTLYDDETSLRERKSVKDEHLLNETSSCKIIGLTIETRPDMIKPKELRNLRRLGVTRLQEGFQHTNDRILYRVNRKCSVKQCVKSIKIAKDCCFKIDGHFMPDLPKPLKQGVSNQKDVFLPEDIDEEVDMKEIDKEMMNTILYHPDWQVDQWKIYPCEVVPYTRIQADYVNGVYKPYGGSGDHLFELLIDTFSKVSPWIRLNRVIRDFPTEYIIAGNSNVSMRQDIDSEMKKRNIFCMDIRNREVKKKEVDVQSAVLKTRIYEASGGVEYFLSFETADEKTIFGFLRLRLSDNAGYYDESNETFIFPELEGCAMIRELHVYGQVKKVEDKEKAEKDISSQHLGFGTRLVHEAFRISRESGYKKIAVISGVGVKNYYRKFGFEDDDYFMTKIIV